MKVQKPVSNKRALSVAECAATLGLSRGLVDRMIREGRIRALHFGGRILISANELDRLLAGPRGAGEMET